MESAKNPSSWRDETITADMQSEQALSAFMDAEHDSLELDLQSEAVRQRWVTYHVIGEAMREPSGIRPVTSSFAARMSAALAREEIHGHMPVSVLKPEPASGWRKALMAWPGVAMAAAVASVIWIAQPLFELNEPGRQAMTFGQTEQSANLSRALDEVEPQADYVSAHRQLAGPIGVRQLAFTPGAD